MSFKNPLLLILILGAQTFPMLGQNDVPGCTDFAACNYDADADVEDGSCDYCSCPGAETDGYGLDVEIVAEHTEGALIGMITYRYYVTTPHDDDFVSVDADENEAASSGGGGCVGDGGNLGPFIIVTTGVEPATTFVRRSAAAPGQVKVAPSGGHGVGTAEHCGA